MKVGAQVKITPPVFDDLLKSFETTVDDGIETRVEEKGDGMQRALMLSILQVYSDFRKKNDEIGKSFLFFIDEAELHLHPTAQRKLKNVLIDLSADGDQVFINTHSSVLVADNTLEQKIFAVEKLNRETNILPVGESQKTDVVFDLLGGTPGDLLLPRNFLIVEGKSEVTFFSEVISRHYPAKPQIQLVPACGDLDQVARSINAIQQTFKPLEHTLYGEKLIILVDKPRNEAAVKDFLNKHKSVKENAQLKELPVHSIEEYYPKGDGWQQTPERVKEMTGEQKIKLARRVGKAIEKDIFEKEMESAFSALALCWEKSF